MNIQELKNILVSKKRLSSLLKEKHLYLKKRYGQNFLHDRNVINKILQAVPFSGNRIIEAGPGIGNISCFYHTLPEHAYLVEIDKGLAVFLQDLFSGVDKVSVIHQDFLKYDLRNIVKKKQKFIFFSNLPYSSGSRILIKLLDYYENLQGIYIMAPKIYADKFISRNNVFRDKLCVLLNLLFKIDKVFIVKKNSFFPVPEVDSVFMKFEPTGGTPDIPDVTKKLKLLFRQKRKKLGNVLKSHGDDEKLKKYYSNRIDELNLSEIKNILKILKKS